MALGRLKLPPSWDKLRFLVKLAGELEIDYQMVRSPPPLLVVETETMVLAVSHQNVPQIINNNPARLVELPVSCSKSSEGLGIVWVENVALIAAIIRDVKLALREGQEPALGLLSSLPNLVLQ